MNNPLTFKLGISESSKNDYRKIVVDIMDMIQPYCSDGKTRIIIKNTGSVDDDIAAREGFSAMIWAAAPFIKGGGKDMNVEELYRRGTLNGTNPHSGEYWGRCGDFDHRFKEMVPIACGMLINSDSILDMFSKDERQNIVNWLYNINIYKCGENAEQFFVILVNSALKLFGRPYDSTKLEYAFNSIENMYIGSGWYGIDGKLDYNLTMTIHFYSLIYAGTMACYDEKRCSEYIKRANLLIRQLKNSELENEDINRLSFYSACLYADVNIYDMGIVKKAINHCVESVFNKLKKYFKAGIQAKYSIDAGDLLALYMKTFLVLTLPDNHSFWRITDAC
jgi:hypothetical protein